MKCIYTRCRHYQHYHHHHHHRQSVMLLVIASVVSPKPQDTRLSPVVGSLDCGPYRYTENTKLFQSLSSRENIKRTQKIHLGFPRKFGSSAIEIVPLVRPTDPEVSWIEIAVIRLCVLVTIGLRLFVSEWEDLAESIIWSSGSSTPCRTTRRMSIFRKCRNFLISNLRK